MFSLRKLWWLASISALSLHSSAGILPPDTFRVPSYFVALATGHVDQPYSDSIANSFNGPVSNFRLASGDLPNGLSLSLQTGIISGRPTEARTQELLFQANSASGQMVEVKAALSILTPNESEIVPGQYFGQTGPFPVNRMQATFQWTSSFDKLTRNTSAEIFVPKSPSAQKFPVMVFHRGRGFHYQDYQTFLTRVSSWGIVCASISNPHSFYSSQEGPPEPTYDMWRPELGMQHASSAQEALMDYLLERNGTSSDALHNKLDADAIFLSGHSRGGGATQASHQRSLPLKIRGLVYFMAYDLRYFGSVAPPALPPAYDIETYLTRLPSLVFSASNDGDLYYPFADEFIDRATGPMTFVTVHRGVHNHLADGKSPDGITNLTSGEQQALMAHFVVAFIKRWAAYDVSLDGLLYGNEGATSSSASVAYFRNSSPLLKVDDFQDNDPSLNALGGSNSVIGMERSDTCVYPNTYFGDSSNMKLSHTLLRGTEDLATFTLSLGPNPVDVSGMGSVQMRMKNNSPAYTFDGWLKLTDMNGQEVSVKFANGNGQSAGYLPGVPMLGENFNRFLSLNVPIQSLFQSNPSFDFTKVESLSLLFGNATNVNLAIDDVRFEGGRVLQNLSAALSADGRHELAPESIGSLYGTRLASLSATLSAPLPLSYAGTTVFLRDSSGVERPCPLFYVSPSQINFLVPAGTSLGWARIQVQNSVGAASSGWVQVNAVAPGLFSANRSGKGPAAAMFFRLKPNQTPVYEESSRYVPATNSYVEQPVDLDVAGGSEVYLVLFGTGLRGKQKSVMAKVGGLTLPVSYSGPQGNYVGLDQINILLPPALQGTGKIQVSLEIDGVTTNSVSISIQ